MKYKYLPTEIKEALNFNNWIMWSIKSEDIEINYYDLYRNFRYWCVDVICDNGLLYSDMPDVNDNNQNDFFKRARKFLDIKKLRKTETHNFDLVLNEYGKYEPKLTS